MNTDPIRVKEMEALLRQSEENLDGLERQLEQLEQGREDLYRLLRYYGSQAWFVDRERDLPPEAYTGVLSEDRVYVRVEQARDLAFRMLELATDLLKNL